MLLGKIGQFRNSLRMPRQYAHYVKIGNQKVKITHLTEAQGSTTFHRRERTIDQRERMINQWQYIIIGRKYTIDQ